MADIKGRKDETAGDDRDGILNKAILRIKEKKFDEAERLLKPLLPDDSREAEDEGFLFLAFNEPFEEIFYRFKFKPRKEIRKRSASDARIFLTYATVLMGKQEFDAALKVLGRGLGYNPIDTDLLFEEGEIFKIRREWTVFRRITDLCLSYAYKSSGIARAYRNFGYMFLEQGDYDGAISCYLLSREYNDHAVVRKQLERIPRLLGRRIDEKYYKENFRAILEERKIQVGPSRDLLQIAYTFAEHCEKDHDYQAACYFYGILLDLTKEQEIEEKLTSLKEWLRATRH